jgi:8-oxo-dGTP diphosphatase
MEEMIKFNARCYVLIRSKQNRILVMQERWQGVDLNKFPGGGLELGEGLLECIHREIAEEFLSSEKLAYSHFFTPTEYFASRFKPQEQLLLNYFTNSTEADEQQWSLIPNDANLLGMQWLELKAENAQWFTLQSDRDAFLKLLEP